MAPIHKINHQERNTTHNGIKLINYPIGLERPKEEADKYANKIKCQTNPADTTSTTYDIPMVYFKEGTLEEWMIFMNRLGHCITGNTLPWERPSFP